MKQIAVLAATQFGVVTDAQLTELALPNSTRRRWIQTGLLHRIHPGVVAVGHRNLSFAGTCMAAVLAAGPGAHVTGPAAAWLRRAIRFEPKVIDVAAPHGRHRKLDRVRIHACDPLPAAEKKQIEGIPVVSPARMLVDLAGTYSVTKLAAVMHELEYLRLLSLPAFQHCMHRLRRRRGPTYRRCMQALELHTSGSAGMQSPFERRAADRLIERGAPLAEVTPAIHVGHRVRRPDLFYRAHNLAVEVNGAKVHNRNRTRNEDAIKAEELLSVGIHTLPIEEATFEEDIERVLRWIGVLPAIS